MEGTIKMEDGTSKNILAIQKLPLGSGSRPYTLTRLLRHRPLGQHLRCSPNNSFLNPRPWPWASARTWPSGTAWRRARRDRRHTPAPASPARRRTNEHGLRAHGEGSTPRTGRGGWRRLARGMVAEPRAIADNPATHARGPHPAAQSRAPVGEGSSHGTTPTHGAEGRTPSNLKAGEGIPSMRDNENYWQRLRRRPVSRRGFLRRERRGGGGRRGHPRGLWRRRR